MESSSSENKLIYLVDDDPALIKMVAATLTAQGFKVKKFERGEEALRKLPEDRPELVVLDLVMPGADGFEVAKGILAVDRVPILFLSARKELACKLTALNLGADDYLTKPFWDDELTARIRAILRRACGEGDAGSAHTYRLGGVLIDLWENRVTCDHSPVKLTRHEWAVLRALIKNSGKIVSPRQLLQEVWGPEYGDEGDYVRTYIGRLRKKLEPDPSHPQYILLERGMGYRLAKAA